MIKRLSRWLCVSLLVVCAKILGGEAPVENLSDEYVLRNWTVEDGLPQNSITAIAQSPDGYLWMGTFNGLVRFDGVRFTIFDSVNTPALNANPVHTLLMDRGKRLWIYTEGGGLTRLENGVFTRANGSWGLPDKPLDIAGELPDGRMVFIAPGQFLYEENPGGKFVPAGARSIGVIRTNDEVNVDSRGDIFVKREAGWSRVAREELDSMVGALLEPVTGKSPGVLNTRPRRAGGAWLAGHGAILAREGGGWKRIIPTPAGLDNFMSLEEDRAGDLWIATRRAGLWRMEPNGSFHHYLLYRGAALESLRELFEDNEGNLWVGTENGGVYRLRRRSFQTVGAADGLRSEIVKSIAEDKAGRIWAANAAGMDSIEPAAKPRAAAEYDEALSWSALCDSTGTIWLGTYGGTLLYKKHGAHQFAPISDPGVTHVIALYEDPGGQIWAGADSGLWRASADGVAREALPTDPTGSPVRAISGDRLGNLWVGLNSGGLLERAKGVWREELLPGSPRASPVWALAVDDNDAVWIGTPGSGLYRKKDGHFFHFDSERTGLPRFVASIVDDGVGSLWMGSTEGIFRVRRKELNAMADGQPAALAPIRYTQADGLDTSECSSAVQPVALRARDGRLWFATRKGVAVCDPKNSQISPPPPRPLIEEAVVWGQTRESIAPTSLIAADGIPTLHVPPGSPLVEIHYTAPSFSAPDGVRFRYRLEGADKDWVEAGTRRIAYYERLSPAAYRFRVGACNQEGVWNESEAVLGFVVEPFFWQRWWFLGLIFGSSALVAGWVFRYFAVLRLERRLALLEREHAIERERQRIARDMHDDLGSDLARLAMMTDTVAEKEAPKEIVDDLRGLAGFTRVIRHHASELVWLVNPRNDTLSEFASYVCDYAERTLAAGDIRFRWDAPLSLPALSIPSETRRNLFLVVKEGLNNLVRHSGASEARLTLALEGNTLSFQIADDGEGFDATHPKARPGGGNGLMNMAQRLEACGGRLTIRSQPGEGTLVSWTIPVSPDPTKT
jgi:ligand-binding sensor domain-containing protein/signal transduction histidine kinase